MDYNGFVSGVTVYFPVFARGALLFLGDGHAVQGDGELTGMGVEISMEVRVWLGVLKGEGIRWPRGEDGEYSVWMEPHQEEAVEGFVRGGGAFLPLHNAGWAYPWKNGYRRVMGGYYQGHPPVRSFTVTVEDSQHPITRGVSDYEIVDEQHFLWFDYDRVDLLLKSRGEDGKESAAGWAYEYGSGRVAYLANGHTLENLRHEMVQRLLHNAARWLLRQE